MDDHNCCEHVRDATEGTFSFVSMHTSPADNHILYSTVCDPMYPIRDG